MRFCNCSKRNIFSFLVGGTFGAVLTFMFMNSEFEKPYLRFPSNVQSVKLRRRGSSVAESSHVHGIIGVRSNNIGHHRVDAAVTNVSGIALSEGHSTEFNIVAALFSGHHNWANSRRMYRNVTCPEVNGNVTVINAFGNPSATKEANVVMFARGGCDAEKWKQLIAVRRKEQIWLHSTEESIYHSPPVPQSPTVVIPNLRFNVTYGYHLDSDIFQGFGEVVSRQGESSWAETIDPKPPDLAPVAWMSSRDHMYWNRSGFVRDFSKYISIDMFGKKGDRTFSRKDNSAIETLKRYKFYLSLENSCCRHYVTEKFWHAMAYYQAVPIVVGPSKADYESVAPPNSFIFANDFDSMESLANYIKKVSSDPKMYDEFHRWRKAYDIVTYHPNYMHPFMRDDALCVTLKFLRDNGWRKDRPLKGMDPYDKDWLRSCTPCGQHEWLAHYDLDGKTYLQDLERNTKGVVYS